jgi:hypothetical protein
LTLLVSEARKRAAGSDDPSMMTTQYGRPER